MELYSRSFLGPQFVSADFHYLINFYFKIFLYFYICLTSSLIFTYIGFPAFLFFVNNFIQKYLIFLFIPGYVSSIFLNEMCTTSSVVEYEVHN